MNFHTIMSINMNTTKNVTTNRKIDIDINEVMITNSNLNTALNVNTKTVITETVIRMEVRRKILK